MAKRRLAQMLETEPTTADVIAALPHSVEPQSEQPCLNPVCRNPCIWTGERGRPPLFCSLRCFRQFTAMRAHLTAEITILEDARRSADDASDDDRRRITQEISKRRWALRRYPAADDR